MACIPSPLNGAAANSEGGRLARMMRGYCYKNTNFPGDVPFCKVKQSGAQIAITPPESIRVSTNASTNRRITQEYVKSLLAAKAAKGLNYATEDARILALQASTAACVPPDALSSRIPAINTNCLPIPPPPGPPARCALTKNQKY